MSVLHRHSNFTAALRVVVLCGADSGERDVSRVSGMAAGRALAERGHEVVLIDPSAQPPVLAGPTRDPDALPSFTVSERPPDLAHEAVRRERMFATLVHGPVLEHLREADVAFLAVHGGWGEDGHLQALLDMIGTPYSGAGSLACAASWDKDHSLRVLEAAGIPVTERFRFRAGQTDFPPAVDALLGAGRAILKPLSGGSSIGVHLVSGHNELRRLSQAAEGDLILEPFLSGREYTVGIVGDDALPVAEIELEAPIFDYRAKYQPGVVREVCPAEIPPHLAAELAALALRAHGALGFGPTAYSRVDFRCDGDGNVVCLELNALPGLNPGSLLPLAAEAAQWSYPDLIERILDLALRGASSTMTVVIDS